MCNKKAIIRKWNSRFFDKKQKTTHYFQGFFFTFWIPHLPVWGWAPCHGGQWEGYFWAGWTGPKPLQQNPVLPPEHGSDGRSSWHKFQEPEWQELHPRTSKSTIHTGVHLAHKTAQTITHSQSQHDLPEVLISHNSLLQSFDRISGPE